MTTLALALLLATQRGPKLSALFSDNAVLQRDLPVPVFGTGDPGAAIDVDVAGQRASTIVGSDGTWTVRLPPLKAGGPYTLSVNHVPVARNVMVGEVWLASGQSNMEFVVSKDRDAAKIKSEPEPEIRMFNVQKLSAEEPAKDVGGAWNPALPDKVGKFSAVGYWFARTLHDRLHVPVGILHSSWGGTPAESWTSREALTAVPALQPLVANYLTTIPSFADRRAKYEHDLALFAETRKDVENAGFNQGWQSANFDDSGWKTVTVPISVEDAEGRDVDGAFWFRRPIDVPAAWAGKELKLELGTLDDFDKTYLNGNLVGSTGPETADWTNASRVYRVAPGIFHPGTNVLAVRIFDQGLAGGFTGGPTDLQLSVADGSVPGSISLAGDWRYKAERIAEPESGPPASPIGPGHPWAVGGLYDGMIAPLIPYAIRGAIWYQGESNADRAYQYRTLFPTMIRDWRARWGEGDFPFDFVQLPNFKARTDQPGESAWAEMREAQAAALQLPNTGMATTIDLGEAANIHPTDKQDVGYRLALEALHSTYGKRNLVPTGPSFDAMHAEGGRLRVSLKNATGMKTTDRRPVAGFAVAGGDHKFYWADARIEGNSVVVDSPQVPNPVAVRYAWADNPAVNLVNAQGLPAVPFRTDAWTEITMQNSANDAPAAIDLFGNGETLLYPVSSARPGAGQAAVVVCPGGGYAGLADHEGAPVAKWLESIGVRAFVLHYHVAPHATHPGPLNDVSRAIRYVRAHAAEWGVDPKRVGVLGFSAGGHLASTVTVWNDAGNPGSSIPEERESSRPDLSILIYPVVTMRLPLTHQGSRENLLGKNPDPALVDRLSNELQVTDNTPPCFLVHGSDDTVVPVQNSLQFARALADHHVPFELHVIEHGPHGFGMGAPGSPMDWRPWCAAWLKGRGFGR